MPITTRILGSGLSSNVAVISLSSVGLTASMWEVVAMGSQQNRAYFSEIEMASSPGGANLCTGGTPSITVAHGDATTTQGSPVSAAIAPFDGDQTTRSGSDRGVSTRFTYTFASPVNIREVRLLNGGSEEHPRCVVIRASTDGGVTWSTMGWYFLSPWTTTSATQTIAVTTTPIPDTIDNARAWAARVSATRSGSAFMRIGEIAFATSAGGADITTSTSASPAAGWPFMDSFWILGTTRPDPVVDNGTDWTWTWTNNFPHYVGYAFTTTIPNMAELRITCQNSGGDASDYPLHMEIVWTANGVDWNVTDAYTSVSSWSNGVTQTFAITP